MRRGLLSSVFLFSFFCLNAQTVPITTARAHSHNDYEQAEPFTAAWKQGFGSIEADVFLVDTQLLVAHERSRTVADRTIESLYLQPLAAALARYNNHPFADSSRSLQLMIDCKTEAVATLQQLVQVLKRYPSITSAKQVQIVISGNRPEPDTWQQYPTFIWFDGELQKQYPASALQRIPMMSANLQAYTKWNGKGRLPKAEQQSIDSIVRAVHAKQKKLRFWNAPDFVNAWYFFLKNDVDFINTDRIPQLGTFLQQYPMRHYEAGNTYELYKPTYRNDGKNIIPRNVILLIGDGTGLAQWYAGYTVNGAKLNVFQMKHIGLSKTASADSYITDSAPGATAFSSGEKTNNRAVGVDTAGKPFVLLPELFKAKGMRSGLITAGDLRDATPAAFYAHQSERSQYAGILQDFLKQPVDLLAGSCHPAITAAEAKQVQEKASLLHDLQQLPASSSKPVLLVDTIAAKPVLKGRGPWLSNAFDKATTLLSANNKGFFLMMEGAQVDHGGHANNLPWAVSELNDLDQLIGKAMQFADRNGETLIIVTGDHETGGLTLTSGDFSEHRIDGQFSTGDHTAIPVPVFAYGPGSQLFSGVYENTEIHHKIVEIVQLSKAVNKLRPNVPGKGK